MFLIPAIKVAEILSEIWIANSIKEYYRIFVNKETLCFYFENLIGRCISACPLDNTEFRGWACLLHPTNNPLRTPLPSDLGIEELDFVFSSQWYSLSALFLSVILFKLIWKGNTEKDYLTGPSRMRKIKSNEREMSLCYIWQVFKLKYSDLETLIYHIRDADILEIINLLTQQSSVGFFSTFLWCFFFFLTKFPSSSKRGILSFFFSVSYFSEKPNLKLSWVHANS